MKRIIVALALLSAVQSSYSQHSFQVDDGAGGIGILSASGLPLGVTTFSFPTTGGQLLTSGSLSGAAWMLTGNGGTTAGTNFVGTTDLTALHLYVNSGTTNSFILTTNGSIQRDNAGNARGTNAVDMQFGRAVATQVASGIYSVISGGKDNRANGQYATIGGGTANIASGDGAVVAGGGWSGPFAYGNTASGLASSIIGGAGNVASGIASVVAGGGASAAANDWATVVGGTSNLASGFHSTIVGGGNHVASGDYSFIGGGFVNEVSGSSSVIAGGYGDTVRGDLSAIVGGIGLTLDASADGSVGFLGNNPTLANNMIISAANTAVFGNTDLWLANNDNVASELRFYEAESGTGAFPSGTKYVALKSAATLTNTQTYSLPLDYPSSNGLALVSTTGGAMSWAALPTPSEDWNVAGNTSPTTNIFGTLDAVDVDMRAGGTTQMTLRNTGGIEIPATTNAGVGVIYQSGTPFIHTFGTGNIFAGSGAGNFTMSGGYNVAIGTNTLTANTTGNSNIALGASVLYSNTSGLGNIALGSNAMYTNTTGFYNIAVGVAALRFNTTGSSNTAVGSSALTANTTGGNNTGLGSSALYSNTTGNNNTGVGQSALAGNTLGDVNTAVGANALGYNTTASQNVAIGNRALYVQSYDNGGVVWQSDNTAVGFEALNNNQPTSTSNGINNTALGSRALYSNTTGSLNTASGASALQSNTTGFRNTASGYQSLSSNTTGYRNTSTGASSLSSNTTGNDNTASGASSLVFNTTGIQNSALGSGTLYSNTTGSNNTASGYQALFSNTTGGGNTASGESALRSNTSGSLNTALGESALISNTSGSYNTASGVNALNGNTTGNRNTAMGLDALAFNTIGSYNTASGGGALQNNTTASQNVAIGHEALRTQSFNNGGAVWNSNNTAVGFEALLSNQPTSTSNGISNTASGYRALRANTTGYLNTASGASALLSNTTGAANTATGYASLNANTTGGSNTASGYQSLTSNTTGGSNTAFGTGSLNTNTTGGLNTAIGGNALQSNTTGDLNTAIGYLANVGSGALNNATAIGANATVNASNKIQLGDGSVTRVSTYGSLSIRNLDYVWPSAFAAGVLTSDGSGNLSWAAAASGDVVGPASALDNAVTRFDGTTGKLIQNSALIVEDYSTSTQNKTVLRADDGATANISLVLAPKGAGALIASNPNGATLGGNARGNYAVDLQLERSGATEVASGLYSVITGGRYNTASNSLTVVGGGESNNNTAVLSVIGGGYQNIMSGPYSVLGGGSGNTVAGDQSVIPGGRNLTLSATADNTFGFNSGGTAMTISAASTSVFANSDLWLANNDNTPRQLRFYDAYNASGAFPNTAKHVAFKAPAALTATQTYTLPLDYPSVSGYVLSATTGGVMSWVASGGGSGWALTGNAAGASDFLGTTNTNDLELKVNSKTAMRFFDGTTPNIVGGYSGNSITSGVTASAIAGGGSASLNANTISEDGSFIGGGEDNVIGDNDANYFEFHHSVIGGGFSNKIVAQRGTISGGENNDILAGGDYGVIGGGSFNTLAGSYSAIPGGFYMNLTGNASFGFNATTSSSNTMTVSASNTAVFANTDLWLGNNDGSTAADASQLRLYEPNATNGAFPGTTNYNSFQSASQSADINYTLPTTQPSVGQTLTATAVTGSGPYAVTTGWGSIPVTIYGGNSGITTNSGDFYCPNGMSQPANETAAQIVATRSGTLKNLFVKLSAAPVGATKSKTITVRINGANTALTTTITNAATTGSDVANAVSFVAGDLISITVTHTNAPNASIVAWGVEAY